MIHEMTVSWSSLCLKNLQYVIFTLVSQHVTDPHVSFWLASLAPTCARCHFLQPKGIGSGDGGVLWSGDASQPSGIGEDYQVRK